MCSLIRWSKQCFQMLTWCTQIWNLITFCNLKYWEESISVSMKEFQRYALLKTNNVHITSRRSDEAALDPTQFSSLQVIIDPQCLKCEPAHWLCESWRQDKEISNLYVSCFPRGSWFWNHGMYWCEAIIECWERKGHFCTSEYLYHFWIAPQIESVNNLKEA